MIDPEHYFPGQDEDEKIFLFIRKHWLTMLGEIISGLLLVLLPVAVLTVISASGGTTFTEPARNFVAVLVPAYYLILAAWLFIQWLKYYLDVAMVTNERLVDIDQRALFKRSIAELNLAWVQDVDGKRTGPLETFFDFGDVTIQTAGERTNFVFHSIPHPHEVAQTVIDLQETLLKEGKRQTTPSGIAGISKDNAAAADRKLREHIGLSPDDHPLAKVAQTTRPPVQTTPEQRAAELRRQARQQGVPLPPEETTPSPPPPAADVPAAAGQPAPALKHTTERPVATAPAPTDDSTEYQPLPREYERGAR